MGDVLGLCDHLGADQVDLVGHDWGAIVAWMVAAQHPERLRTLTVVSVPHPEAFADAYASASSNQHEMSSYIDVFRAPGDAGERMLRGDDGDGLKRMFEHVGLDPAVRGGARRRPRRARWPYGRAELVPGDTSDDDARGAVGVGADLVRLEHAPTPPSPARRPTAARSTSPGPFRYEVLEGVDHWVPELEADRLNELLLAHLSSH